MLYVKTAVSWKFLLQGISSHHENPVFQGFRHIFPLWSYLLSSYFTTCLIGWLKNWPVVPKTSFFCEKNMWFFSIIHETFCLCGEKLSEKLLWCLTKYFCGLLQLSDSPASPAKKLYHSHVNANIPKEISKVVLQFIVSVNTSRWHIWKIQHKLGMVLQTNTWCLMNKVCENQGPNYYILTNYCLLLNRMSFFLISYCSG